MKLKLLLITVLALGGMAHAQGFASHLAIGAGFEGIFPAATVTKPTSNLNPVATTQWTTNSVGAVADARYDFGHHSALDLSLTVNRNTEAFQDQNVAITRVQTNNAEVIGTYIFRLPSTEKVKPYALLGGGMIRFSPNSNFTTQIPSADIKPAFAYGFGFDFKTSERWAVRLQLRDLIHGDPDFKLLTAAQPFGTGLKTHVPEPSIQLVYHF